MTPKRKIKEKTPSDLNMSDGVFDWGERDW
jgi:hypothetical protein